MMSEKAPIKISLSTFFLVIAILVIIFMAMYLYIEKTNSNKTIAELENSNADMENTIDNLQNKIDSIADTINSNATTNSTTDNSSKDTIKYDVTIEMSEIENLDYSNKTQLTNFYNKYKGKTIKMTGYVNHVEDNVIVSDVDVAETVVSIGNSTTYRETAFANGSTSDTNIRKQINKLNVGQKISIVGTIDENTQPIELHDIKLIEE